MLFLLSLSSLKGADVTWCSPEWGENITTNSSVFELTVASRQRMTVKRDNAGQSKECGSSYLYSVTWIGWHIAALTYRLTREKKREAKWLAGALGRKWALLPSAEVGRKKISCWTEVTLSEPKAKAPGKGRRKVARTRSHIFKPVLKITKSVGPLKRKYSPQESIEIR